MKRTLLDISRCFAIYTHKVKQRFNILFVFSKNLLFVGVLRVFVRVYRVFVGKEEKKEPDFSSFFGKFSTKSHGILTMPSPRS